MFGRFSMATSLAVLALVALASLATVSAQQCDVSGCLTSCEPNFRGAGCYTGWCPGCVGANPAPSDATKCDCSCAGFPVGQVACTAPIVVNVPSSVSAPSTSSAPTCAGGFTVFSQVATAAGAPIGGISVTFTLTGEDASLQAVSTSCTASSDAAGTASCALAAVAPSGSVAYSLQATVVSPSLASSVTSVTVSTESVPIGVSLVGPTSGKTGEYFLASATSDFVRLNGELIQGQWSFFADSAFGCGVQSTAEEAALMNEGSCRFTAPIPAGSFQLKAKFEYQADVCRFYRGEATALIAIVDVAAVAASVATETAGRIAGDAAEATDRQNAINQEALARSAADTTERDARIAADAAESAARAAADTLERDARVAGDATERDARIAADAAEVVARDLAIGVETSARIAADNLEITIRTSELDAIRARLAALESSAALPAPFIFRGLVNGLLVQYPNGVNPGPKAYLNEVLAFSYVPPTSIAASTVITYNGLTGIASITQPGTYRLDAFIHFVDPQTGAIGTGAVAWLYASGGIIGPNILNPNAGGVNQGVQGDDSIVSSMLVVPAATTAAPVQVKLVLLTMNQKKNLITDASTISITQL